MKLLKHPIWLCILFALLWLNSCVDEIEFDVAGSAGQLVVDGGIHNGSPPYFLNLAFTSGADRLPRFISGAKVFIEDGDGVRESFFETEEQYVLIGQFVRGVTDQSYFIEIELPNGKRYQSRPEKLPSIKMTHESSFEIGTTEITSPNDIILERPAVFIDAKTQVLKRGDPVYLRWELEMVHSFIEYGNNPPNPFNPFPPKICYVFEYPTPQEILLFSDESERTELSIELDVATIPILKPFQYANRQYFNVIISSMSEERFQYWERAQALVNQQGTVFDTPPANILGNVFNVNDPQEPVFGYFDATLKDTTRFFVNKVDLDIFVPNPCSSLPMELGCDECTRIPGSTLVRPHYWN